MVAQAMDAEAGLRARPGEPRARLIAVRFGNVLGSNGSVVPKFKAQIAHGGPVTVTHPDMVRYFMTMREAADLVITAGAHAHESAVHECARGQGDGRPASSPQAAPSIQAAPSVYVLKMGQPVRIMDLADRMIRLAGLEPGVDVEILVTGARPGERLNEILFARGEPPAEIGVDGVMAAHPTFADRGQLGLWLGRLGDAVMAGDRAAAALVVEEAIPEYAGRATRTVPSPAQALPPREAPPAAVGMAAE